MLALYGIFYMLDGALVLLSAVLTSSHHRLQPAEAGGLACPGAVMAGLGLLLVVEPAWLVGG